MQSILQSKFNTPKAAKMLLIIFPLPLGHLGVPTNNVPGAILFGGVWVRQRFGGKGRAVGSMPSPGPAAAAPPGAGGLFAGHPHPQHAPLAPARVRWGVTADLRLQRTALQAAHRRHSRRTLFPPWWQEARGPVDPHALCVGQLALWGRPPTAWAAAERTTRNGVSSRRRRWWRVPPALLFRPHFVQRRVSVCFNPALVWQHPPRFFNTSGHSPDFLLWLSATI